jgi:hypothetical protein
MPVAAIGRTNSPNESRRPVVVASSAAHASTIDQKGAERFVRSFMGP